MARTQERYTVKITYAGDREPEYHHWPDEASARRFFESFDKRSFEISMVEFYHELHMYSMWLHQRWERNPKPDDNTDGTSECPQ